MAKRQQLTVLITIFLSLVFSCQGNCTLCEDGSSVPSPFQDGLDGMTCAELAIDAGLDAAENCVFHQGVVGTYCGCNNTIAAESACRICFPGLLPDYLRVVDGRTCMQHEFLGSVEDSCGVQRHFYGSECCASNNETASTASPSMLSSNSTPPEPSTNETSSPSIAPTISPTTSTEEPTGMPASMPPSLPPTIRPTPALMGSSDNRNSPSGALIMGRTFSTLCLLLSWILY